MSARQVGTGALALLACVWLAGCSSFGKVQQGRTVAYDAAQDLVTVILDSNPQDPRNPRYDVLPAVTVRIPADRSQMGPAPRAGKLLAVDPGRRQAHIFDAATGSIRAVSITPLEQLDGVASDDARVTRVPLPRVDRTAKTVTLYAPRQRQLLTFSLEEAAWALPETTWVWGDEVRYYYRDPGQALRLMNVTRTDITKGK